jgi:hypothetical protein
MKNLVFQIIVSIFALQKWSNSATKFAVKESLDYDYQ